MDRGRRSRITTDQLADALYVHWYTRPDLVPPLLDDRPQVDRRFLLSALRAAHAEAATLLDGWVVTASEPRGHVAAVSGTEGRHLHPGEYLSVIRPGVPLAPGEPIRSVARRDQVDSERGIWWTFSSVSPEDPTARVYVDVRAATAPRVVHVVTGVLAQLGLPYRLKTPVFAEAYDRADAMVLYLPRSRRQEFLDALVERWPEIAHLLDPGVPALTCPVRPGLAWADDPGPDHSYGQSRCEILAAGIAASRETWTALPREDRIARLIDSLRGAGLVAERPWESARMIASVGTRNAHVEAALTIARRLVSEAIETSDGLTWTAEIAVGVGDTLPILGRGDVGRSCTTARPGSASHSRRPPSPPETPTGGSGTSSPIAPGRHPTRHRRVARARRGGPARALRRDCRDRLGGRDDRSLDRRRRARCRGYRSCPVHRASPGRAHRHR